jgi:hypothetical protein
VSITYNLGPLEVHRSLNPELKIETHQPYLEELLIPWKDTISDDSTGNEVFRKPKPE